MSNTDMDLTADKSYHHIMLYVEMFNFVTEFASRMEMQLSWIRS